MDKERKKWRAIIRIVIDVILFLSKQNLSFRCHREDFDSKWPSWRLGSKNQGSFLETVKLIVEYNPVVNEHLSDIQASEVVETETWLKLRDRDFIKNSETENWNSRPRFETPKFVDFAKIFQKCHHHL